MISFCALAKSTPLGFKIWVHVYSDHSSHNNAGALLRNNTRLRNDTLAAHLGPARILFGLFSFGMADIRLAFGWGPPPARLAVVEEPAGRWLKQDVEPSRRYRVSANVF